MDAPGARGDDARAALAALRDASARAHFAGDAAAVAAALACYDGVWRACGGDGDGALPPIAAAAVATELRRETLLLLSAAPSTPWAARDALDLRLALLKRVWVWSAAERAAAAGKPVPAPASPAALKRTASGRAPPPPSFEGVVATLGGCDGAVLLPLLQLLLNETAFGSGAEKVETAANENNAPPQQQQQPQPPVCPFAPATPPTLPFDPFGDGGDALAAALPALAVSEPEAVTPAPPPPPPVVLPSPPDDDDEPFAALSPVPRRAPPPPPPAMRARANV